MAQAVVTGATGGIGRAVALALRDAGHRVLALGRDPDALADLAAQGFIDKVTHDIHHLMEQESFIALAPV